MTAANSDLWKKLQDLWLALDGEPQRACRDCADHDGACPNDGGLPCDPQERALEQIKRLRLAASHPDRETLAKSLCKQAGGSWTALVSGQPCIANWREVGLGTQWFWLNLADVILPLLSGAGTRPSDPSPGPDVSLSVPDSDWWWSQLDRRP